MSKNKIRMINSDCMVEMKKYPDNYFDLAIVDPPYFSGPEKRQFYGRKVSPIGVKRHYKPTDDWDVPNQEYFDELIRVSKHQIIWGFNYYDVSFMGSGRIVWNKINGQSSFSDCEIAYCSFHDSVRMFSYMWNGMMQGKSISEGDTVQENKLLNEKRIHPTQKPVILYKWLLTNYAKEGFKILDTHLGSGSHAIACYDLGYELTAFEIDKDYYDASVKRFEEHSSQMNLFIDFNM